jgi:hypothetical protein
MNMIQLERWEPTKDDPRKTEYAGRDDGPSMTGMQL